MGNSLFGNDYIEGFSLFKSYLSIERQLKILNACRKIIQHSKLIRPKLYGKNFVSEYALMTCNAGRYGWLADEKGFRYSETDIQNKPFLPIPDEIMQIVKELAPSDFVAENCLINFYQDSKGKKSHLGLHQDKTEKDLTKPIISISIGQACVFSIGGQNRDDPVQDITLYSGDVIVMSGFSRNCFHSVKHLIPNTCPKDLQMKSEARINITVRQVYPNIEIGDFRKSVIGGLAELGEQIQTRNEFQSKHSADEYIKSLEVKMLPSYGLRTKEESPIKALTPEERLIYADYLESEGQVTGANAFRNYVEPVENKKKKER